MKVDESKSFLKNRSSSILLKPLSEVMIKVENNHKTSEWPSQSTFQAPVNKLSFDDENIKKLIGEVLDAKLHDLIGKEQAKSTTHGQRAHP